MHQEAITRAAIRNINISQRRNEREKPLGNIPIVLEKIGLFAFVIVTIQKMENFCLQKEAISVSKMFSI